MPRAIFLIVALYAGAAGAALLVASVRADDAAAAPPRATQAAEPAAKNGSRESSGAEVFKTQTVRGRIVWLAEALRRRYGIESDDDAAETSIAVEAVDGQLYPLVKDFHARGFWLDQRLRERDGEFVFRRYGKSPSVQLVRWFALRDGHRYEVDYWCDICSIPMYELKTCDCCQGEIRLRERVVEE